MRKTQTEQSENRRHKGEKERNTKRRMGSDQAEEDEKERH